MKQSRKKKNKNRTVQEHIDPSVIRRIGTQIQSYNSLIELDELRKSKDKFMDLYQKCEFAYKQILVDYKINHDGLIPDKRIKQNTKERFNPNNLKIFNEQYPKVYRYAGIPIDDHLFSSEEPYKTEGNKSCRLLRNEITHSSSKKAIQEVYNRHESLFALMNSFLNLFQ